VAVEKVNDDGVGEKYVNRKLDVNGAIEVGKDDGGDVRAQLILHEKAGDGVPALVDDPEKVEHVPNRSVVVKVNRLHQGNTEK